MENSRSILFPQARTGTFHGTPVGRRLSRIEAPSLVVMEAEDDVEARQMAEKASNSIPDSTKTVISGASRLVNIDNPKEFNRIVLEFLRTHERSI